MHINPAPVQKPPKRNISSYAFFCKDFFKKQKKLKNDEADLKSVSVQWKKLPDSKKAQYIKLAKNDKTRYQKELAVYQ